MSFRHLTSGERRRLRAGILSPEEATKVSIRAGEKSGPSTLEKVTGGVRLLARAVAGAYTGGASTPLITSLERAIGSTPESQLGIDTSPSLGGRSGAAMFDTTDTGSPELGGSDWAGSLARILTAATPVVQAFTFPRSPLSLPGAGGLRELPQMTPGVIYPFTPPTASGASLYRRTLLHRISQRLGHRVTVRDIVRLVRQLGISATAAGLGESETDIGGLFFYGVTRHRRRRGISARDISRARSTIRRMQGFMRMLHRGGFGARRALPAHHGHRVVSFRRRAA